MAAHCFMAVVFSSASFAALTQQKLTVVDAPDSFNVHDLQATILHLLGFDHTKLTYKFQGRDFRLTDVHGNLVKQILA